MKKPSVVLPGEKRGRLTVIRELEPDKRGSRNVRRLLFKCDCGKEVNVRLSNFRSGAVASCGCGHRRYREGVYKSLAYRSWDMMKQRCTNPKDPAYHNYGGRGIQVCERWLEFGPFHEDMGERPSKDHSLDRIDNNGNYEPGNCRWATRSEQNSNRRDNVRLTLDGRTMTATQWAKHAGINPGTFRSRLRIGHTLQEAINNPRGSRRKKVE